MKCGILKQLEVDGHDERANREPLQQSTMAGGIRKERERTRLSRPRLQAPCLDLSRHGGVCAASRPGLSKPADKILKSVPDKVAKSSLDGQARKRGLQLCPLIHRWHRNVPKHNLHDELEGALDSHAPICAAARPRACMQRWA
jgi:hypothetical protein